MIVAIIAVLAAPVFVVSVLLWLKWTKRTAIIAGSLILPALIIGFGFYDLAYNLEVDSPPPGSLIIGGMIMAVIAFPISLGISASAAALLKRN